jgi:hypothetical protein
MEPRTMNFDFVSFMLGLALGLMLFRIIIDIARGHENINICSDCKFYRKERENIKNKS